MRFRSGFMTFALVALCVLFTASAFAAERLGASKGQSVYVPVYSHVYHGAKNRAVQMTTMVSIRNTNRREDITLTAVRYYDTKGHLVRSYVREPIVIPSMATQEFIVSLKDTTGGSGANFIVEWEAATRVSNPVVEALMLSTESSLGISFVRPGRILSEKDAVR
ncbi:DUF3124 domain-containing protein [Desulfobaculum sp. SPO524]|uniref:DUF3124 domain-containing protein n=1 Tax=Desulfobaculum sp. SPO524 TaxID=3378071 RepID=UPI00385463E9